MLKRKRECIPCFPDDTEDPVPAAAPDPEEVEMTLMSGDELSSDEDEQTEEEEESDGLPDYEDMEHGDAANGARCVCCELAGSEVMRALDLVADRLAGRAGERHIIDAQLGIYNQRMAPLRAEGRHVLPLTRKMLRKHYRTHRVSVMRSVAEEIRVFDLMQRTLRRTMCDVDPDNQKLVSSRNAQLLFRASKAKLDLIKFYTTLEKQRHENEANASS